jgi:3-oxoacyl-[acyl-carrier-protein] synthase II
VDGVGVVTALGESVDGTWAGLAAGRSGVGRITRFDARGLAVRIAAEVHRADEPYVSAFLDRRTGTLKERFAFMALDSALHSSGMTLADLRSARVGVFTGCEKSTTDDVLLFSKYEDPETADEAVGYAHQASLAERFAGVVNETIVARIGSVVMSANYAMACSASAVAIAQAVRWLRRRRIDLALVVGTEAPVTSGVVHGFQLLDALSSQNDAPEQASRPFDTNRDGFVLAEGAGAVVLTRAADRASGQTTCITGVGMTNNGSHITKTPADGERAAMAMQLALRDAGLSPRDIGYINAHATSTDVGDIGETAAIRRAFEVPPPVSSTKSMTGHLVAAAGIVEFVITATALERSFLPPTINQVVPDPECTLDYIANAGRACTVQHAITNSFGFGGTNVSIVVSRS